LNYTGLKTRFHYVTGRDAGSDFEAYIRGLVGAKKSVLPGGCRVSYNGRATPGEWLDRAMRSTHVIQSFEEGPPLILTVSFHGLPTDIAVIEEPAEGLIAFLKTSLQGQS
jgi:hypothetical protein